MLFSVAVLTAALGAVFLILGASRAGWKLLGIAVLLAAIAGIIERHAGQLLAGLTPVADTLLSIGFIAALLYLVGARRARPSSRKDRVDRS